MLKKWNMSFIDVLIIIAAILFITMLDSNNMGIYFDSVFPDYLSVHILNPDTNNPIMNFPYIGIPLLGQLYHGTVTVFLQIIVVGILGEASLFSLRLCNAIWCSLACASLYFLLKKLEVKRTVILFSELCLIFSIPLFMILKTQYYIKVPGTAFTFLALLSFVCGKHKANSFRYALLSGFLAGLAFYSYFIYLFFVPAYLYLYIKDRRIYNMFSYLGGFSIGCIGYVVGYGELLMYILNMPSEQQKFSVGIITLMLLFISVLFIWITCKNIWFKVQGGGMLLSIIELLLVIGGGLQVSKVIFNNYHAIKEYFSSQLNSLDVSGYKTGVWGRVKALAGYTRDIFSDACEIRVLGKHITIFSEIFLIIAIILLAYLIYKLLFDRALEEKNKSIIKGILVFLTSYYCMALAFATRMGVQHFVPIYFLAFFTIGYGIQIMLERVDKMCESRLGYVVCIAVALLPMEINCFNLLNIHNYLISSGCVGYYTTQINKLAYEALDAHDKGKEEFYIFPEWGIMSGFNYLTNNQINYSLTLDDVEQSKIGKTVKLCYFDEDNTDKYIEIFDNYGVEGINVYEYPSTGNGSYIKIIEAIGMDNGFLWKSGRHDDNWIGKNAELIINNGSNENKEVKISYYTIAQMDNVNMRILNNENEIGIYSLKEGGGEIVFEAKPGREVYKLEAEICYNPAREGNSSDTRDLTIIVNSIEIMQ